MNINIIFVPPTRRCPDRGLLDQGSALLVSSNESWLQTSVAETDVVLLFAEPLVGAVRVTGLRLDTERVYDFFVIYIL